MSDVFFYEAFEEESEALRRDLPPDISAEFTRRTIQEHAGPGPPAALISVRTQSDIPLAWAPALTGILARATGYDHLAAYRAASGVAVPCGRLPVYCHRSVAEHALTMWMALGRKLIRQRRQFGSFLRDGLTGTEFESKRLLVVGVGNIGHEVCRIGKGLAMDVQGVDLVRKHGDVAYADGTDAALPYADVVVCAMNLTPDNAGYFGYDRLRRAKQGAIFVNVARGEQSPATDLLRLLQEGRLGGVGLDVYANERDLAVALRKGAQPDDAESRAVAALARRADAILTPHNAFNTREAVRRKSAQSVEQIVHFLEHRRFKWPVP